MSSWLESKKTMLWLWLAVFITALSVVYSSHKAREAFVVWQQQLADAEQFEVEWGRLLLEKSSSAAYGKLQWIAEQRLHMQVPEGEQLVFVKPKREGE